MKPQDRLTRWIDGEEEELDLTEDNPIPTSINPTVAIDSPAQDSVVQGRLRAELKRSGLKVCYQSRRNGGSDLYVMDADGSNSVNITRTPALDEVYPHVSRDSRRVCFTVVRSEQLSDTRTVPRFDVYWMNMNGSNRTLVARDATDPCWDPTGKLVAFVKRISPERPRDYQNTGLFTHDINASKVEELTGGKLYHAYVPCWSPTGDWIVLTIHEYAEVEHAIIAFELDTKRMYVLKPCGIHGCRPDLSWDGEFICWNANDVQIGVAKFDPRSVNKLPVRTVAQAPPPRGSVYYADWSPDGRYIAYSMNSDFRVTNPTGGLWDVFVTRVEGGPSVQLTFDHSNNKQPEFFLPR